MEEIIIKILGESKFLVGILAFVFIYHKYNSFFIDLKSIMSNWLGIRY
jgi:hypothetical protein